MHMQAFGADEGPEIIELVNGMFNDKTAEPLLSLVAADNNKLIGHIIFSKTMIIQSNKPVLTKILAPLAVLPEFQNKGVGSKLITKGLEYLKGLGIDAVFVLGHPEYYSRFGFKTAGALGFQAPYPIPERNADAWMVKELKAGVLGAVNGKVKCAETLSQPHYWRE